MSGDCVVQSPWSEQDHHEQVSQGCIQLGFKYMHGDDYSLFGKPIMVFDQPHSFYIYVYICKF